MSDVNNAIKPQPFCYPCRYRIIRKAKFKEVDNWRLLEIMVMLILIKEMFNSKDFMIKYRNDVHSISKVGCLGCALPKKRDELIEIAKKDRTLGELSKLVDNARNL